MAYAEPQLDWDKEKAEIEKEMVEAYKGGDFKKVDAVLEKHGFKLVDRKTVTTKVQKNDGVISPASYGSDVDLTYDYYYNAYRGKYLTKGYWRWKNSNWDFFPTPDDAFGLWLRKTDGSVPTSQVFDSQGIAYYDQYGNVGSNAWCTDFDVQNAGCSWEIRDYVGYGNYYGYSGQGWIWLNQVPTGSLYLYSKLIHTWSGGSISNITIGTSGLSATLSGTSSWQASNFIPISSWPKY